jgi:hypothetical protein
MPAFQTKNIKNSSLWMLVVDDVWLSWKRLSAFGSCKQYMLFLP